MWSARWCEPSFKLAVLPFAHQSQHDRAAEGRAEITINLPRRGIASVVWELFEIVSKILILRHDLTELWTTASDARWLSVLSSEPDCWSSRLAPAAAIAADF